MSTLFTLFPGRWNSQPESEGSEKQLGLYWSGLLEPYPGVEKAVFLDSLLPAGPDAYPAAWRRFIRVGNSIPEQIANLFELCFEKGYEKVVFAETICAALSPESLRKFTEAISDKEMVFLPADDGSVLMASMDLHLYSGWDFYRFYEPGSIVEILSDCHEKGITYSVMDPLDLAESAKILSRLSGS